MDPRLSALLVQERAVSFGQMDDAARKSRETGLSLADTLLDSGCVDEATIVDALGRANGDLLPLELGLLEHCDESAVNALTPLGDEVPPLIAIAHIEDGVIVATCSAAMMRDVEQARDKLGAAPFLRVVAPFRMAQIASALYGTPIPALQQGLARRYPLPVRVLQPTADADVEPLDESASAPAPAQAYSTDGPWRPGELDLAFARGQTKDQLIENTLELLGRLGPRRAVLVPSKARIKAAAVDGFECHEPLAGFSGEFHPAPWVQAGLQTDAAVRASIAELGLTDWYGFVEGELPSDLLLAPVSIRGRMILLLLVDNGGGGLLQAERTPWLSVAAHRMANALGLLIATAKGGSNSESRVPEQSGSVEATDAAPPEVAEEVAPEAQTEELSEVDAADDGDETAQGAEEAEIDDGDTPFSGGVPKSSPDVAPESDESDESDEVAQPEGDAGPVDSGESADETELVDSDEAAPSDVATPSEGEFGSQAVSQSDSAVEWDVEIEPADAVESNLGSGADAAIETSSESENGSAPPASDGISSLPADVDISFDEDSALNTVGQDAAAATGAGMPSADLSRVSSAPDEGESEDEAQSKDDESAFNLNRLADGSISNEPHDSSMFDVLEVMPIAPEPERAPTNDVVVPPSPPTDEAPAEVVPAEPSLAEPAPQAPPLGEPSEWEKESAEGVHFATTRESIEIPREFLDARPDLPVDGWDEPGNGASAPVRRIDQTGLRAELDAAGQSRNTTELPVVVEEVDGPPAGVELARQLARDAAGQDVPVPSGPRTAALHPVTDSVTAVGSPPAPLSAPPSDVDSSFLNEFDGEFGGGFTGAGGSDDEVEFSITDFPAMEMPRTSARTDSVSVAADFVRDGRRARTARLNARDAQEEAARKAAQNGGFDVRVSTVPRIDYLGDIPDGFTPDDAKPVRVSQPSRPHAVALDIEASGALLDKTRTLLPSGEPGFRGQAEKLSPEQLRSWLTSDIARQREAAFATILDRGESAHRLLLEWFPHPLNGDRREMVSSGMLLEDHGPVVWLCALQAQALTPGLRKFLQNQQSDYRYYALQVLHRVNDEHSVRDVAVLLFDPDEQIRRSARVFVDTFRTQPSFQAALQIVRRGLVHADPRIQTLALDYAAEFADAGSVGGAIVLLESSDTALAERAARVLRFLTFQQFGNDVRAWERWHRQAMGTRRERWLLDAMVDKDRRVRESAAALIEAIPRLIVNYTSDMGRQGQLAAQRKVERFLRDRPGMV